MVAESGKVKGLYKVNRLDTVFWTSYDVHRKDTIRRTRNGFKQVH